MSATVWWTRDEWRLPLREGSHDGRQAGSMWSTEVEERIAAVDHGESLLNEIDDDMLLSFPANQFESG